MVGGHAGWTDGLLGGVNEGAADGGAALGAFFAREQAAEIVSAAEAGEVFAKSALVVEEVGKVGVFEGFFTG
jgi:hypothetical protein